MLISTEPCKLETLVVNCDDCMNGTEGRPPLGVRVPVLRWRQRACMASIPCASQLCRPDVRMRHYFPFTCDCSPHHFLSLHCRHTQAQQCPSQPAAFWRITCLSVVKSQSEPESAMGQACSVLNSG